MQTALKPKYVFRLLLLTVLLASASVVGAQSKPDAPSQFSALAAKAEGAREADRLTEAAALYRRALALRPTWAEGWFYLGTIHYDRNEFSSAAQAFRRVVAIQPKTGTAMAMLGLSEFQLGLDASALKHLQAAKEIGVADDPDLRQTLLFDEALLLQRKGGFEKAQESLETLCQQNVEREDQVQILGMVQLRLRTTDPGAKSSPSPDIFRRLGHAACLAARKKFDEARPEYAGIVKDYPDFPNVHFAFGNFLLNIPDIPAAREQFEQEIKRNPKDVVSRLKIAAALYRTDSSAGIPYAEQAVQLDPKLSFAHYLYGLLLLDTDDYKRAIPELETAKKGITDDPKLYFALGTAYARAGRTADAERARAQFQRLQKGATNQ